MMMMIVTVKSVIISVIMTAIIITDFLTCSFCAYDQIFGFSFVYCYDDSCTTDCSTFLITVRNILCRRRCRIEMLNATRVEVQCKGTWLTKLYLKARHASEVIKSPG